MIIEASHIYTNEEVTRNHCVGAALGSFLQTVIVGYEVKNWLFIDDYNPKFSDKPEILDVDGYLEILGELGFPIDFVLFESELIEKAFGILKLLTDSGFTKEQYGNIYLNGPRILLFDGNVGRISCPLLDASAYLFKGEDAGIAITILNKRYRKQQKKTLAIVQKLKSLGVSAPEIYPLYHPEPLQHSEDSGNFKEKLELAQAIFSNYGMIFENQIIGPTISEGVL